MKIRTATFLILFVLLVLAALAASQVESSLEKEISSPDQKRDLNEGGCGSPAFFPSQAPTTLTASDQPGSSFGSMAAAWQDFFAAFADLCMETLNAIWRSSSEAIRCLLGMGIAAGMVLSGLGILFIRSGFGLWSRYFG